MFDHMLVPLDGSQIAECVLPHAIALAKACGARITVLRVLERIDSEGGQTLDPVQWHIRKAEAEAYIAAVVDQVRREGTSAELLVLEGDAQGRILEFAHGHGVDLIVLSSHGRGGLTGWNVSGGVQKIISRARSSVMVVRAYQPQPGGIPELRYRRIMIPLDGSQRAECVFPFVITLARANDALVIVPHVVGKPEMPRRAPPSRIDIELSEKVTERNREEAERYLDQLSTRLPLNLDTRLLVSYTISPVLHELADQEQVELVVLSAHGYSGGTKWPYGSTVMSFISYGSSALLIVQDLSGSPFEPTLAEKAAEKQQRDLPPTRRPALI